MTNLVLNGFGGGKHSFTMRSLSNTRNTLAFAVIFCLVVLYVIWNNSSGNSDDIHHKLRREGGSTNSSKQAFFKI